MTGSRRRRRKLLDRRVSIEGPITLEPTVWPTLQVEGARVGNPKGWRDKDFAQLDLARVQLGVWSLLKGDLRIGEIVVDGLRVHMEINDAGEPNWLFEESEVQPESKPSDQEGDSPVIQFVELQEIALGDITIIYSDPASEEVFEVKIDEITGGAEHMKPLHLLMKGAAQNVPYTLTVHGGSIGALADTDEPWPLEINDRR